MYNEVERLNKHPSLFVNYLRVLADGKGIPIRKPPGGAEGATKEKEDEEAGKGRTNHDGKGFNGR